MKIIQINYNHPFMEIFKKKIYRKKSPINYPKRPKISLKSRNGEKKITVYCNLKRFNFDNGNKNKHIMQYSIQFEPLIAEDNYPLKRTIIRQLKEDLEGNFEKYFQAGDTLYICSQNTKEKISLETKVKEVLYKVTFVKTSNYIDCSKITTRSYENLKIKGFLESMIKSIVYSNNHVVRFDNRTFYDYLDTENLAHSSNNGKIWHGYTTAVCITEAGLFLRINDKNKLITGKTAYEKMLEIARINKGNFLDENTRREIAEYFRGKTVIAQYGTYRAYKIGEVTMDQNINNTYLNMRTKEGNTSTVSIKQYYKNQYNIDIKIEDQPLLIEELRKRNISENSEIRIRYLVPELVYLTGIDDLNENERNDILEKSKPQPTKKVELMEKGFKYLNNKEKRKIKKKDKIIELKSPEEIRVEWGINFEQNFTDVEARCLSLPNIIFGESNNTEIILNRGRFRQQKDILPVHFNKDNCMLLTFDNNNLLELARDDCEQMKIAGKAFGINFELPQLQRINNINNMNKTELIHELQKIDYNHGKKMIIVVLDKKTKNLYSTIKDFIYSQTGLASQFMLHDEGQRGAKKKQSLSYYSGVLNQMVVKSNGELFKIKFSEEIDKNPSIIIGIDYSKIREGTKYVVTATYNRRFNKVYTDIKINLKNEENEENEIKNKALIDLLIGALDYFKFSNSEKKPDTVIIYMKGGTEKQTEKIIRFILPDILKLFSGNKNDKCYEENYKPKLTIFSVNKRTELKFFERTRNGYKNIPLGSVIDQKVVSPDVFEFYLQCPEVNLGTASPVHFLCIYNNNDDISLDDYEKITFYQSFYYWNWTGPIRIPAVLKYAEIANSFSTKNLKNEVLKNLKSTPYYI